MKKKKMDRRSAGQWREIIEGHAGSGLGIKDYCDRCGVSDKSFYAWRNRLSKRTAPRLKNFIEVSVPAKRIPKEPLRIQTPGGYGLEVPEGIDGNYVKTILSVLASS